MLSLSGYRAPVESFGDSLSDINWASMPGAILLNFTASSVAGISQSLFTKKFIFESAQGFGMAATAFTLPERVMLSALGACAYYGFQKLWAVGMQGEEWGSLEENLKNFGSCWASFAGAGYLMSCFTPLISSSLARFAMDYGVSTFWDAGESLVRGNGIDHALSARALVERAAYSLGNKGVELGVSGLRVVAKHSQIKISPEQLAQGTVACGTLVAGAAVSVRHPELAPALGMLGMAAVHRVKQPTILDAGINFFGGVHEYADALPKVHQEAREMSPRFLGKDFKTMTGNQHVLIVSGITNHTFGPRLIAGLHASFEGQPIVSEEIHPRISTSGIGNDRRPVHGKHTMEYGLKKAAVVDKLSDALLAHLLTKATMIKEVGQEPIHSIGYSMGGLLQGGEVALRNIARANNRDHLIASDVVHLPGFADHLYDINIVIRHGLITNSKSIAMASPLLGVPKSLINSPAAWSITPFTSRQALKLFLPEHVSNYWQSLRVENPLSLFDALVYFDVNAPVKEAPKFSRRPHPIIGGMKAFLHGALKSSSTYQQKDVHDYLVARPNNIPLGIPVVTLNGPDHISAITSMRAGFAGTAALALAEGRTVNPAADSGLTISNI